MIKFYRMIEYKQPDEFGKGFFYNHLCESYAGLLKALPLYAKECKNGWQAFDDDIFNYPDTIGKCVLVSMINNEPIGFASWDPRRIPEEGIIGQNCILPVHRGKGYGKLQIQKVMEIFNLASTRIIKVTTGDHPFFIPAQRIYLSCGFKETGRTCSKLYGGFQLIHFEYKGEAQ